MPPKKIIETNASSLIDLKALVAQQEAEFNRKRTGPPSQRPTTSKKPKQAANRGVQERAQRDMASGSLDQDQDLDAVEKSRKALERKAHLYDTLQRRGVDDDDDDLLIDFDQKYQAQKEHDRPSKRRQPEEDDPWVEYEDEFGRTRVVRASAVPQRSPSPPRYDSDDDSEDQAERANIRHFEASQEAPRERGVGHYQFATDNDDERQRQMASLLSLRQETQQARKQSRTASQRRKVIVAKRAERIHQHWAKQRSADGGINEDSVTHLLQTLRQQGGY